MLIARNQRRCSFAILVGLICLAGCGDGRIRTYPTTGSVMVDGKPADGAMVIFCPKDGEEAFKKERPWGETDSQGKFSLTTFDKGDGAPAGDYSVMIRWMAKGADSERGDDERSLGPKDRLRGRYFHPEKSGLSATVETTSTEVPPFDLTAK